MTDSGESVYPPRGYLWPAICATVLIAGFAYRGGVRGAALAVWLLAIGYLFVQLATAIIVIAGRWRRGVRPLVAGRAERWRLASGVGVIGMFVLLRYLI